MVWVNRHDHYTFHNTLLLLLPKVGKRARFTPHYCRHWFTTHLRRNGMKREYIKELRGNSRNEAMDIYYQIDRDELRRSYLANIPTLGID